MRNSRLLISRICAGFFVVLLIPHGTLFAAPKTVWSLLQQAKSVSSTPDCGRNVSAVISAYRQVLTLSPKNEEARDMITGISMACASELELAESVDDVNRARELSNLINTNFIDTLWRTGYKAKNGNKYAQLTLGVYNRHGLLVKQPSIKKSCEFYKQAAEQGVAAASYRYSLCLANSNKNMAMKYNRQAAVSGHAAAQHLLGEYYLDGPEKNENEARIWLEKAAAQRRTGAQTLLGWLYATGTGGDMDNDKAAEMYLEAAKKNDPIAQNNLAELYEKNPDLAPMKDVVHWYGRAASQGLAVAQLNFGRLYAKGEGVQQNDCKAMNFIEKAREKGLVEADKAHKWMIENGHTCRNNQ
ncbi:MAG: sel1 repeat family protein [Gammaproteobacteria bacterium]|nr:sel1 repeat family protein [Gammaproteobacteria bacterium]